MAKINVTQGTAGAYGAGELQLKNKAQMSATLTAVTDNLNTESPLKLSTNLVQTTSTLKITTADNPYIDAEDNSGNNRFTVGRDPASQQVNVDFASNPTGSTSIVGAIRTYGDGVNLSEAMAFREDGNVGINTLTPGAKLDVHSAANVIAQFNRTGTGKSWIQYLLAGAAKWNTGFDNVNGNFTIYDAVAAADRVVVTNAGNVGIGTSTPSQKLSVVGNIKIAGAQAGNIAVLNMTRTDNSWSINNETDLRFYSGSGDTDSPSNLRVAMTSAGNVGIGTASPTNRLHVLSSGFDVAKFDSTFGQMAISFANSGTTFAQLGSGVSVTGTGGANDLGLGTAGSASTNIIFATGAAFTERMRITSDGYLRMAAASGGIQFNGDTAAANALDDYEEGTFTPALQGITGAITYLVQEGAYTKIGNVVNVRFRVALATYAGTNGANPSINLPFTSANVAGAFNNAALFLENTTYVGQSFSWINPNTASAFISSITSGGTFTHVTYLAYTATTTITGNITYTV